MDNKRNDLSRLYHAALRTFLSQNPEPDMEPARALGRHAIALGLETLDMARIHEIALVSLVLPSYSANTSNSLMGRAGLFFAEALTPIEQTHRGALEANNQLNQIVKTLSHRTQELADSVAELKLEIIQRRIVEESLLASEQTSLGLLEKSRQMQDELRGLSRQLLTAQEEERRKISRELHDVIAQTLAGINVQLATLMTDSNASVTQLHERITNTQRLVGESVDIVHRFARELRPTVLDDLGLIPALQSFMTSFMAETGIRVSFKVFAGIERTSGAVRTALYRIALEALTNVARHANATHAELTIQSLDHVIHMDVTDDGRGFEMNGNSCARKHNRLGLLGMRERTEMIGGSFQVESSPGQSTRVRVRIPERSARPNKTRIKGPLAKPIECP